MLIAHITRRLPVDIVPFDNETLDGFLLKSQEIHKEAIQRALERYDKDIYCPIDRKRFVSIRLGERTILSSYGILRFKRRYYYDSFMEGYCYLLDNRLQIPKSKRMTNELTLGILDLASIMSYKEVGEHLSDYKEVGEHLSDEFAVSKYAVWKTINEALSETYFDIDMDRKDLKIHVQIDEKFIGMVGSTDKRGYYTLTTFAGKEPIGKSNRLRNKTVISSAKLCDLKNRLNEILVDRYKVSPDEEIFVSGDFATYIQNFGESIRCCKARYVPDRFHVHKTLKDTLPNVYVDDHSLNDDGFRNHLIKELVEIDDDNARKLKNIPIRNPESFGPYLDREYLGCSQEGQNSRIYAPRFGKYANRFPPSAIEKPSPIREARAMNAKVILVHRHREIPEPIDVSISQPYEDIAKYVLDTREMKFETMKMFNAIKYGRL